jgi:hypothetical protein
VNYGLISERRYRDAELFEGFLARVEKNADLWRAVYQRARIPDETLARVTQLGRFWHLLVLSEDWCGDAVNIVPVVARMAELSPNLDLRLLARDENLDLIDAHLTGASRSIPVVILLDDEFRECAWWGPRPKELQTWVLGEGQLLPKTDRYREVRRWYATDKGASVLSEIVGFLENSCAGAGPRRG